MGNKKFLLAIVVLVIVFFAFALYLFWPKINKTSDQTQSVSAETIKSITNYSNSGQGLIFDASDNQIKKIDLQTAKSETLYSVEGAKPNYFALTNNEKSLLLAADIVESETSGNSNEMEHLTVASLDNSFTKIEENAVFSPVWVSNERIAYYVLDQSQGKIIVKDTKQNKNLSQIEVKRSGTQELSVLDENHIIINDFSSDVGDVSSSIVDLATGQLTPYLSGLGLKFKTIPGSKYLGYQTIKNDQAVSQIISWQNKSKILEMQETVDNFDWPNTDKEIIYGTGGQLYRFNIASTKSAALNKSYTEPLLVIKLLANNKLLLKTEEKPEIIDLGGL